MAWLLVKNFQLILIEKDKNRELKVNKSLINIIPLKCEHAN